MTKVERVVCGLITVATWLLVVLAFAGIVAAVAISL